MLNNLSSDTNQKHNQTTAIGIADVTIASLIVSLGAGYFLTFMEWLFFVTKASFFSSLNLVQTLEALGIVSGLVFAIIALVSFGLGIFSSILVKLERLKPDSVLHFIILPSTFALGACALLLIDNFTNTMFAYGVSKSNHFLRLLYLIVFVVLLSRVHSWLFDFVKNVFLAASRKRSVLILTVLAIILPASLIVPNININANHDQVLATKAISDSKSPNKRRMPNILFFATDGISAKLTSAYGNQNPTTPNLDKFIDMALFAKHAFTNSERTTGSTTSMLTGKYPATTKVLFPPHVLTNKNSYQHLPGILKSLGYQTMQESVRYYADANDLNMQNSFDLVNGRTNALQHFTFLSKILVNAQHATLFLSKILERMEQRIFHIFFIKKMPDVFASIRSSASANVYGKSDELRISRGIDFVKKANAPFFIHLHLMDTHCCRYTPRKRVFSNRKFDNKSDRKKALLEDSLKESDDYFKELIEALIQTKKIDNTIIVYSSDHTEGWGFNEPIPLMMMFPGGAHKGTINENVQLIDVAPTILDYLNVDIPEWMEGDSLLSNSISAQRPIFGITKLERERFKSTENERLSRIVGSGPPSYGLNTMAMAICNKWYALDLNTGATQTGLIKNHLNKCDEATFPSVEAAAELIREHLDQRKFAITQKPLTH